MSLIEDLRNELNHRIKSDVEDDGKWNDKLWAKITFGDYYGKSPQQLPIIHRVIGESVDNVLKPEWQMTEDSWNGLKNAIDASDTAETALPDMEEAGAVIEPRTDGGEFIFEMAEIGKALSFAAKTKNSRKKRKMDDFDGQS